MDLEASSRNATRAGANCPESEEENGYSDEESGGENGERPRKRQRRPMSVS